MMITLDAVDPLDAEKEDKIVFYQYEQ